MRQIGVVQRLKSIRRKIDPRAETDSGKDRGQGMRQVRIQRKRKRVVISLSGAFMILGLVGASPALAHHTDYSRSLTGASVGGYIDFWRGNGYVYNHFELRDTRSDGHCAYVETTWSTQTLDWNGIPLWISHDTDKSYACGYGTLTHTDHRSDGQLNWFQKERAAVKVCVDVPWYYPGPDPCSSNFIYTWDF